MKELSDKMKERIGKWLESLDEEEKCQAELLDSYFTFRRNLPSAEQGLGKAMEEHKTTDEIIDDLLPMMYMKKDVVVGWMRAHDYHITTVQDGSPKWAIWRFMDITVLT
ncbi:MAG: hypothetical protein IJT48_10680 [Bacteroidaceae bacterium]|nr:hypothetical protein [Bacteroidaceae bacterium]